MLLLNKQCFRKKKTQTLKLCYILYKRYFLKKHSDIHTYIHTQKSRQDKKKWSEQSCLFDPKRYGAKGKPVLPDCFQEQFFNYIHELTQWNMHKIVIWGKQCFGYHFLKWSLSPKHNMHNGTFSSIHWTLRCRATGFHAAFTISRYKYVLVTVCMYFH